MSTKCNIVMNWGKNFMAVKTNMTAKWEIFKRSQMSMYSSILYTYICMYDFRGIGINQEKDVCLSNKEYRSCNKWERISMIVKCMVHMHITA